MSRAAEEEGGGKKLNGNINGANLFLVLELQARRAREKQMDVHLFKIHYKLYLLCPVVLVQCVFTRDMTL